jgi:UDP-N-acetylmuramyl pentapeptide phosphotransferase/UDP-N-acetylglucosamine-1-phosphate transferase
VVLIVAFLVAVVATPLAMGLARRTGLLDRPGDLKIQTRAVPYLGGLGVAAGLAVAVVPARPALLLPLGLALLLGVVDDARHVDPVVRLAVEVAIGLATAAVLPPRLPGALSVAAVTLLVVLVINGVNMIDGLDALAAGVGLVSAIGFALVLDGDARTVALGLAGALAGFLIFNRPPARVYLGDGGAYLLGATLAALLVMAWAPERDLAISLGALPLVACPIGELAVAVLRRKRSGARLSAGDRSHVYDQLVQRGWSRNRSVAALVLAQAVLVALALVAVNLSPGPAGATVVVGALALLAMVAALGFLTPTSPETAV